MATPSMIGITELRNHHKRVLDSITPDHPITILSRSKPIAILVHPDEWDRLHDLLDDQAAALALGRATGETIPWDGARLEQLADPDPAAD